jgi:hypothetical protein
MQYVNPAYTAGRSTDVKREDLTASLGKLRCSLYASQRGVSSAVVAGWVYELGAERSMNEFTD